MAASPQRVERPDHAGRTDVESLQRQRLLPPVPFVGGPERIGIERRVGVGDDRGDRVLDARRVPRLVSQPLKLSWLVQYGREANAKQPPRLLRRPSVVAVSSRRCRCRPLPRRAARLRRAPAGAGRLPPLPRGVAVRSCVPTPSVADAGSAAVCPLVREQKSRGIVMVAASPRTIRVSLDGIARTE
jgi:hypothetical protein